MEPKVTVAIVGLVLLALLCAASNLMVCYAIYAKKVNLSLGTRYFLFSLALTDLMVGVVNIPLYISYILLFQTESVYSFFY